MGVWERVKFWDSDVIVDGPFYLKISFSNCWQSLFQDDFNESLEPDFEGVTKTK